MMRKIELFPGSDQAVTAAINQKCRELYNNCNALYGNADVTGNRIQFFR